MHYVEIKNWNHQHWQIIEANIYSESLLSTSFTLLS